jgi:uncharacterized protein (TIGR03435 family)
MKLRIAALALACSAYAQGPAFEVASVKRSEPITPELVESGRLKIGVTIDARSVRMSQMSLFDLTSLAYQVKPHQVAAPQWTTSERYDIQAKLPEGGSRGQVPAMLQTLLAERFAMRVHRETREFNVLALVQAKGGHKLKASPPGPDGDAAPSPQIRGGVTVGPGGAQTHTGPGGDSRITPAPNGALHIETKKVTMKSLADFLFRYVDRPVVDMTDAPGLFDAEFDISDEEAPDPSGVSLRSSLQKLGLRLESRKAPAEVIVVDAAEKVPTAN